MVCNQDSPKANNPNYVCNPATGRWVKRSGRIGQSLVGVRKPQSGGSKRERGSRYVLPSGRLGTLPPRRGKNQSAKKSRKKSRKEFTEEQTLTLRFARRTVHHDDPADWLFMNAVPGQEFPNYDDANEAPLWVRSGALAIVMIRFSWSPAEVYAKIGRAVSDEVQSSYDAEDRVSLATAIMNDMTLAELYDIGI